MNRVAISLNRNDWGQIIDGLETRRASWQATVQYLDGEEVNEAIEECRDAEEDGHAKNFSLFIEPHGRYTLTPLYDVMSAYPIFGKGANRLAPQKARMAMAVGGKNRHYKWMGIQPRHWLSTAASVGLQSTVHEDIHELVLQAPAVVDSVSGRLPEGFPEHVAGPILDGLLESANRLSALE